MIGFGLCVPAGEVKFWAENYLKDLSSEERKREAAVLRIGHRARTAGLRVDRGLSLEDLMTVAGWKSQRRLRLIGDNDDDDVRAVTGIALATSNERLAIELLQVLRGVGWSIASAILHLAHGDPYPILDFRALRSVCTTWTDREGNPVRLCDRAHQPPGCVDSEKVAYTAALWRGYTEHCRQLARAHAVRMRTLDRALWKYDQFKNG